LAILVANRHNGSRRSGGFSRQWKHDQRLVQIIDWAFRLRGLLVAQPNPALARRLTHGHRWARDACHQMIWNENTRALGFRPKGDRHPYAVPASAHGNGFLAKFRQGVRPADRDLGRRFRIRCAARPIRQRVTNDAPRPSALLSGPVTPNGVLGYSVRHRPTGQQRACSRQRNVGIRSQRRPGRGCVQEIVRE